MIIGLHTSKPLILSLDSLQNKVLLRLDFHPLHFIRDDCAMVHFFAFLTQKSCILACQEFNDYVSVPYLLLFLFCLACSNFLYREQCVNFG